MALGNSTGNPWLDPLNIALFFSHVGLWTLWTILIRSSQATDGYSYDVVTVVLLTELTKLCFSTVFHLYSFKPADYLAELKSIISQWRTGIYFAVPAFIYTLYNFLFYLNLTFFDPVAYRVLINMRIIWSGLLFQVFFNKALGMRKWFALALLMVGCAVNQIGPDFHLESSPIYILAVVFQAFTSSLGGVYSEVLLKKDVNIGLNIKNMYLYFFAIVFNGAFIVFFKPHLLSTETFFVGYSNTTYAVILVGAFCGFSTSLFLKYLSILLKEYAHSGEMFVTAIVSYFLFDTELSIKLLVSMLLVCFSVMQFNRKEDPAPSLPPKSAAKVDE
eukprot:TRINITY_DN3646_c0_g1_i1.p1 TRINITY_DN3646_c0_g1~~TRINITY_DN3646_c0_g1_i1.p1  ORF type:complete len:352 (+),score=83.06 TRINITY_DN3646_c0_g1_i1:66-1058(+)